ncbi:phage tail tape measure protein [Escherichia coli]|nr:phage tail tape measure protein [Escherichia coli]
MPQRNDRSRSTPTTSPKINSWFRMQAGHQSDADIYIYDEIGFWGVTAKQFISDLNALGDITHINLHINSPGGDVFEGIAIFNALKTHGASITVYVDGVAASMASVIAMVGNPVIMPENTFMMIHKPFGFTGGDAEDMRTYADLLDKVEAVLLPAYAQKTGKTTDEIAAMLADETWIAMSALAEETGRRTADIDNNLNALGSTLKYLSDLWSRFWDAAMNIGREDSLDEQIAALQEKVSRAKRLPWTASSSQVEYDQQRLNDLQEKKRQKDLQDAKEQAERNYQEQQKRRNAENAALNRMNETEAARHQREIARINAMQYADQAVRDAAIQRENERYEKALASGKKKTRETRNDEATRLLLQYSQQQAQVEGQIAAARQSAGIATDRMTEAHKQLLALQQRISDLDGKKLTANEKSVLARKDELIQALTLLDVKQQELQKQTALNELKKKTIQLTSQLAEEERAQRQQHDLDIATVGMGDQQRQRYQVQLSLRQKYQQQLEQLRRDSEQKGTYNTDDYRKAEQALTESLNRQLNENRRYWQQLEIAQGDWKNGVLRALQNVTENADNTAGTVEQLFTSAFSSMSDWLATFCTTGKLNFKSFTSSVLSDMSRIMAQIALMKAVKGIASALPFDFVANADGGVYQSADLSRYSGTVVNRPTFFAFAKGAGVMGEAGPEAILPLRRGADGKLGVVADIGGSGMAMFAPQYNIEINNDGTNGQIGPAALKVVYDLGKKAAADFMQQQARDGGRLSGAYR